MFATAGAPIIEVVTGGACAEKVNEFAFIGVPLKLPGQPGRRSAPLPFHSRTDEARTLATGADLYRIGLIVPSSNTTMETELPELFRRRSAQTGELFTWHSARASMARVMPEELERMVQASDVAAQSLADSPVDVIA